MIQKYKIVNNFLKGMKKSIFLFIIYFLLTESIFALSSKYFDSGKKLFEKKKYEKSRILFERDIVFNPKNENSYLYLAKIFKINEDEISQELNLNTVLLLNPKNDEAVYLLALLKIKQSNYNEAKKLIENLESVCKNFCLKIDEVKTQLAKLTPENGKNNN